MIQPVFDEVETIRAKDTLSPSLWAQLVNRQLQLQVNFLLSLMVVLPSFILF